MNDQSILLIKLKSKSVYGDRKMGREWEDDILFFLKFKVHDFIFINFLIVERSNNMATISAYIFSYVTSVMTYELWLIISTNNCA